MCMRYACCGWILVTIAVECASGDEAELSVPVAASVPHSPELNVDLAQLKSKLDERDRLQREIDELRRLTRMPEQVLVRSKMLEVNLTKMRKLGVDFQTLKDGKVEKGDPAALLGFKSQALAHPKLGAGAQVPAKIAEGWLAALVDDNLARVLAEPTIVVVSGRPASIHVGGEIPVPNMDGRAIEFRPYGTELNLLAEVLGHERVRLHLQPRVSELDAEHTIIAGEYQVPAMTVRQCDFTTEVESGQSALVSGLTQERVEVQLSETGQHEIVQEIALLVVVTPELVK